MSIRNYMDDTRASSDPILLSIVDDRTGKDAIHIKGDGSVAILNGKKLDEAALMFWQNVADMIPLSEKDKFAAKLNLIKAFSLIKEMDRSKGMKIDAMPKELQDQYYNILEDIHNYFQHRD